MQTILIVDEDMGTRLQLIKELLGEEYHIQLASDVREAYSKSRHCPPHAVILNCTSTNREALDAFCMMLSREARCLFIFHGPEARSIQALSYLADPSVVVIPSLDGPKLQQVLQSAFKGRRVQGHLSPITLD
ncbi:MAG: hypothetical protein HYU36_16665 [Planctomycetes bacterium]|nr:hypothetical protein [Planctomycetota bacterium]